MNCTCGAQMLDAGAPIGWYCSLGMTCPDLHRLKNDTIHELAILLKESGARLAIGLRQQGKFETVAQMLRDQKGWHEIGRAIGWEPRAAAEWFARELLDEHDKLIAQSARPGRAE